MNGDNSIKKWLYNNSWNLIVTFVGLITFAIVIRGEVNANAQMIYALQKRVDAYPSEDYFEEKFRVIEKTLDEVKAEVKDLQVTK